MDLNSLRDEYDLARRYTQALVEDLSEADVQWRPSTQSSSIAWHLGHQAATAHFVLRNLINAEASLNPAYDALFDSASPVASRDQTPPLADIVAYREAIAARAHAHMASALDGGGQVAHDAAQQVADILGPILVSLINHEYQHDCWINEMRAALGRPTLDDALSTRVRKVDGYWGLRLA